MKSLTAVLRIGDDIQFRGVTYRLTALDGDAALLVAGGAQRPHASTSLCGSGWSVHVPVITSCAASS
jgi:hypothetical protein